MRYFAAPLLFCLLVVSTACAADIPAKPAFVEKPITPELLKEIRNGGFVLYMRHGNTDNNRPDRVPSVDLDDCSTQRPLSDEGRELMKHVGKAIREARIPLGQILVSPMCRTRESAQLAIGDKFQVIEPLMYSANMTSEEKKPRIEALKTLLAAPVTKGTNTLMIAHAPNLHDLIGFFVKPEGTVVVFRLGGPTVYEYVASIHPDDWRTLPK
jgi:phosphohistidine phosphatase SixA